MSDIQKNVISGRRKGCPNYPPEFKQHLVAASCEPSVSISKMALENGINANLLFEWHQHWRQGKLQLPASPGVDSPQLLPIMLDAETEPANQLSAAAHEPETFNLSYEVAFRHGTLRLDGAITGRVDDQEVPRPLRQTRTRKPFPESLPRDEKRLLPAETCCPDCGGVLSYLGEYAAEQLELMCSAFRVIRTVREKHACRRCDRIVQVAAPSRPIE